MRHVDAPKESDRKMTFHANKGDKILVELPKSQLVINVRDNYIQVVSDGGYGLIVMPEGVLKMSVSTGAELGQIDGKTTAEKLDGKRILKVDS